MEAMVPMAVRETLPLMKLVVALVTLSSPATSFAAEATTSQFHFRIGYLNTSFSGVLSGTISNLNAFDLEYEIFNSNTSAFTLRTTLVYDLPRARVLYSYTGIGKRIYVFSDAMAFDYSDTVSADQIIAVPKLRTYLGGDFGISQVVVQSFGAVLQTQSSLVEFGPNLGAIYQLTKSLGLELQVGISLGLGFSTVSVNGITMRAFAGGSYYF